MSNNLSMKKDKRRIIIFVALTYGCSYMCWYLAYVLRHEIFNLDISLHLTTLGNFMPSILGIIFILHETKKVRIDLNVIKNAFCSPIGVYLLAFFLMPMLVYFAYWIGYQFNLVYFESILVPIIYPKIWPILLLIPFFIVFQGPLGEEFGWRQYLLTRLLRSQRVLDSSLIVGLIWSGWHLPKFFIENTIQHELVTAHGIIATVMGYTFYTICLSILMTVLYLLANKRVLIVLIFHAMANFAHGLVMILTQTWGALLILVFVVLATGLIWNYQKSKVFNLLDTTDNNSISIK